MDFWEYIRSAVKQETRKDSFHIKEDIKKLKARIQKLEERCEQQEPLDQ